MSPGRSALKTRTFAVFGTLCLLLLMLGCTKKKSPETIVFDDWWNLDYLKNACAAQAQAGRHCSQSPDEILSQVENDLQVAFASESGCHDVQLVRFTVTVHIFSPRQSFLISD